jgi:uncharacterized protein (TIGR02757 family)
VLIDNHLNSTSLINNSAKMNLELKDFLEEKVLQYNRPSFIDSDPIQVPHKFERPEDIEISAFLTASIAWGQRKTIISNAQKLMKMLDQAPYAFIKEASEKDFNMMDKFVHRTFQREDMIFFLKSLQNIYKKHGGLRNIFEKSYLKSHSVKDSLISFRKVFFEIPHLSRTEKHISDVLKNSAAKRLNLFLMWMVRNDNNGVHFGLWKKISPAALFIPLDVHMGKVSRSFGLLKRKINDWSAVEELTAVLKQFDHEDPCKYDFALFGMGVFEKEFKQPFVL